MSRVGCGVCKWRAVSMLALVAAWPAGAFAEETRYFHLEGFGQFLDGNPETTAVTEDGEVILPPVIRERFTSTSDVFSVAAASGDEVIVARAEDGQVLSIDRDGKTRELFRPEEGLVTALAVIDRDVFVGTGMPGKIYRVQKSGKSELYYSLAADYAWSITRGPKGALYVATGAPGTVVRVDKKDKGEVVFAPRQSHLRALIYDRELGMLVGGSERGIVYRAANSKDFRALFDSGHPEITAIATLKEEVYAAAVTGAQALAEDVDEKDAKDKSQVNSQLFRLAKDGAVEVLAGSNDEAIFALAIDDRGQVQVATAATGREDPRGRIYSVDPKRRLVSLVYQSASRRITHLLPLDGKKIAAVSASGSRIVELTGGLAKSGEFVSLVHDAGLNARFGILQVFGETPRGTELFAALRTGQTAEPDETWSPWSKDLKAPGNAHAAVPNGRYAQVRLTLKGDGKATPRAYRARVAYVRDNLAPYIAEVVVLPKGVALYALPQEPAKSKTINLTDKAISAPPRGDDDTASARARQADEPGALTVRVSALDLNGDALRYTLSVRREGEGFWQVLAREREEPFYTMQSSQLPDGRYVFRVEVSDAVANPPGEGRSAMRDSRSVLIDNTPPAITGLVARVSGRKVVLEGVLADDLGPLVSATYSLDASSPSPLRTKDGVLDGPRDELSLTLEDLAVGPHRLTVRVRDEGQNEAVASVTFVVK